MQAALEKDGQSGRLSISGTTAIGLGLAGLRDTAEAGVLAKEKAIRDIKVFGGAEERDVSCFVHAGCGF